MLLIAFFSDKGVPKTGLTPTIDVWEDDATHAVNAQNMTEIAGGFYKYDFAGYDESKEYSIRADGGVGLTLNDRYAYGTNEVGQVTEDLTDIKGTGFVKDTDSLVDVRPETDKIQTGIIAVPNNYKADVSNLDVAVSTRSSHAAADIWAVGARTLTSFGTLIADIWGHAARTLTSFGTLIADIWANATRTLTAGTKDTEIDAIKLETDKIQPDIIGSPDNYKADVAALALEATVQLIKTETDKIIYVLGLVQENFRLKDQVYNAEGNLLSATIRIYGSAADCEADVSAIAEYKMTAAYDASGNCTSYKVKKT